MIRGLVTVFLLVGLSMGSWAMDERAKTTMRAKQELSAPVTWRGEWGKQVIAFVPDHLTTPVATGNVIDIRKEAVVFLPPSVQQSTVFPKEYDPKEFEQEISAHYTQNLVFYAVTFFMIVLGTL